MVRSKFPGKPSKIVNRKIVNTSRYSVHQDNESTKAAENISYGLAVFNEAFGDHDQALKAFHGFSPHEVEKAKAAAMKHQQEVAAEYEANGMVQLPEDALSIKLDAPSEETVSLFESFVDCVIPGYHVTRAQCRKLNLEHVPSEFSKSISPSKFFSPFKGSVRKHVASRLLQRAKRSNSDSSSKTRVVLGLASTDKATSVGAMRKFVLPSRSAHSSRVIKPNKRFLDSDENSKEATHVMEQNYCADRPRSRTIELKKPRLILNERDFSGVKSDIALSNVGKSDTFSAFNCGTSLSVALTDKSESKERWKHVKLGDLNVFGAPTTRPKLRVSRSSSCGSTNEDDSVVFPPNSGMSAGFNRLPENGGNLLSTSPRVILREAKLNFNSSVDTLQEGLFSKKPKKNMGFSSKGLKNTGTSMECGVCGSVRLYRFVKLPQKFGINSCEPCRKFIAKMMIKARSSDNTVECEKGQGKCSMPSVTREVVKGNRCWACWLLMCVQRYVKMPEKTRDSLVKMLPSYMCGAVNIHTSPAPTNLAQSARLRSSNNSDHSYIHSCQTTDKPSRRSSSPISKRISQALPGRVRRKAALVSLANTVRKVREKTVISVPQSLPPLKKKAVEDGLERPSKVKKAKHDKGADRPLKTLERGKRGANKTLEKGKDGLLRQKLALKGPRVKHVCRSASIVLGQPLATFPNMSATRQSSTNAGPVSLMSTVNPVNGIHDHQYASLPCEVSLSRSKLNSKVPVTSIGSEKKVDTCTTASAPLLVPAVSGAPVSASLSALVPKSVSQLPVQTASTGRKVTRLPSTSNNGQFQRGQRRTLQALGVYTTQLDAQPNLISLDFWESYDPDEVCNTGFGLIGFDPFHVKPVCFLCGSAGRKKLIHCASCCEPYHQFCVEMGILGGPLPPALRVGNDEWRVDWVCPRCTVCHGCGHSTGEQLTSCQRCYHSYHIDCLGTTALRKSAGNHPWICSSCLHCKSCNSPDVLKFVGNLPFCKPCFRLRQKGNFCPLCQGCYADDDFQSKMMECAECKSWVHAKCEGLSDEKYQVLSYLPESVEFICRLCCTLPPAPWWLAVESELQAGYVNIIKAITKNRKACAMLKWSPKKSCNCRQSIHNAAVLLGRRRLSFNNKSQSIEAQVHLPASNNKSKPSVFEFDDDTDAGENAPILKYVHSKEKSKGECVRTGFDDLKVECGTEGTDSQEKVAQFSPHTGSQSDSGIGSTDDELKASSAAEEEETEDRQLSLELPADECCCTPRELRNSSPSLMSVKKKVHIGEYASILEFHRDMDQLISEADSDEVKELYHQTLQEVFPWFDPKYTRVNRARKDNLPLSPCKPHHGSILQSIPDFDSPDKQKKISSESMLENLIPEDLGGMGDSYYYSGMSVVDTRVCALCKLVGDGAACEEGRLLYCGHNEWVHVNCALWSAEVFEEIDGALQNVTNALSRGRMIRCPVCGKKGASVGCCSKKCEETLHYPCARKAGFVFMEDKNVYCSLHGNEAPGKPLTKDADFDVCRPVYVELDRRKKKSVESRQVRLTIGSLMVESLGKIVAEVSDQGSMVIPSEFHCTRLFWSSKEPWRIVRYTIRTSICVPAPEPIEDLGLHVTVDHSKEEAEGSMHVEMVSHSENEATPKSYDEREEDKVNCKESPTCDASVVRAVLNQVLDAICHKEVEEEVSDPQNPADLLPPELKDAIFEDLPHDLLDGISMQDIFQDKFLNFEETEQSAEGGNELSSSVTKNLDQKLETGCEKSIGLKTVKVARELKRSKSDVLPSHTSQIASRLHQRSCSLAWSCKLGTSLSHCKGSRVSSLESGNDRTQLIQELRLSVKPASSVELKYHLQGTGDKGKENQSLTWQRIMQVDGLIDTGSCSSESGSDEEMSDSGSIVSTFSPVWASKVQSKITSGATVDFGKKLYHSNNGHQNLNFRSDQQGHKLKRTSKRCNGSPRVKLVGRDDQRTVRISQLDGAADLSSDSDHDTGSSTHFNSQGDEKPVRCSRCHCTYRTEESYARHLPNCSGDYSLTTSESEAEISEDEASGSKRLLPGMDHNPAPSPDSAISVSSGSLSGASSVSPTMPVTPNSTSSITSVTTSTTCIKTSLQLEPHSSISQNRLCVPHVQRVSNLPSDSSVIIPAKVPKVSVSKSKSCKVPARQTIKVVKGNQTVSQLQQNQHHFLEHHSQQQHMIQQTVQHSLQQSIQHSPQQSQQVITMLDYQQPQQSGPTVLVQSVPSAAMVPAYLEAFQQHTGQNLQYLATVDASSSFGKTQYLTAVPSTVVPGTYQLQAMPDGQLCLDPSSMGLSTIPSLQLAQPQPQMLGALIQSPLPCGVVATTEPLYETLQMYPDQSGGVLLASQPMLTCMETVVSNTYMQMSSSQFVSSTVPGMLQGSSSFSRTTTQVFQANKVDPPVMDVQAQYVVVNPHTTLHEQNVGEVEVVSVAQNRTQEPMPVQSQGPVHISSINLPVPVTTISAPLPPQTLPPVIPTSVVAPMPRIQPQRTYSKTSKNGKDLSTASVKNTQAPDSVSVQTKHDISVQTSTVEKPHSRSINVSQSSVTGAMTLEQSPDPNTGSVPKVDVKQSFCRASEAPVSVNCSTNKKGVDIAISQPELQVNTAPVQSVTLPDPIKSKHPSDESLSNSGSKKTVSAITSGKVPPVTFSYRSLLTKSQQKTNVTHQPNGWPGHTSKSVLISAKSAATQPTSNEVPVKVMPTSSIQNAHPSDSQKRSHVTSTHLNVLSSCQSQQPPVSNLASSTIVHPSKPGTIFSNVKPVATIVPSAQTPLINTSANVRTYTSSLNSGVSASTRTTAVSSGSISSFDIGSSNVVSSSNSSSHSADGINSISRCTVDNLPDVSNSVTKSTSDYTVPGNVCGTVDVSVLCSVSSSKCEGESPCTAVSTSSITPTGVQNSVSTTSSSSVVNTVPVAIPVISQLAKSCRDVRSCPSQTATVTTLEGVPATTPTENFTASQAKSEPSSTPSIVPFSAKPKDVSQANVKSFAITNAGTTCTTATVKPISSAICGTKPLQEINQTSFNVVESKTAAVKPQVNGQASFVPPTVLKSSTQNVDASRRPSDAPVVFATGDKSPASLKLLFQKQAHNGCYKVSSTPGKQEEGYMAVKLADISIIHSCLKEKKNGKDMQVIPDGSENVKPVDKYSKKTHQHMSPQIMYEIHCQDGFTYTSTSISEAWQKVFGAVQEARANHKMPPLLHNPFSSSETAPNVLGLNNNNIKYLLEQLPGVGSCSKYRPVYHKSRLPGPEYLERDDSDTLPKENRSGCARTDSYFSAKKYDMFSWLDSRHRCPPKLLESSDAESLCGSRRATSVNLPMAMRFRHLRETSKTSVGVFRSDIHGRGLFCLRDIEAGEMVIEYAGEVIRNTLTDNRERYYQSKGIGCYMFKVDDNFTVDATRRGNAARFINHSCEPNCYSRVVDILGKKHIIIFAFRRIPQGEELTYDYKFPIEDEKIHCHCLARRCRKYLN